MCSSEWKKQYDTRKAPKWLLFYEDKLGQDHVAKYGKNRCVAKLCYLLQSTMGWYMSFCCGAEVLNLLKLQSNCDATYVKHNYPQEFKIHYVVVLLPLWFVLFYILWCCFHYFVIYYMILILCCYLLVFDVFIYIVYPDSVYEYTLINIIKRIV